MNIRSVLIAVFFIGALTGALFAQTTEFTYQGKLNDGANPANANYDFEFALYDAPAGGSQIGITLPRNAVAVANGVFSVNLDFGAGFPGADRYLDIRVRLAGGGSFTTLSPRQRIASTPYSIKSIEATTAATATNATTAAGFTGALAGDVTGVQSATVVSAVGGQTAANIASAVQSVASATATNTANMLVRRDASGNFAAGTITGSLAGNAATATNAAQLGGVAAANYLQTNGNGSGLTNLNASNITTGTLENARLGVVPIANGGTGSAIKNFVDLTTTQTIGGNKTFSNTLSANVVNSATHFSINGTRVLDVQLGTFVGPGAGQANEATGNSFYGFEAGIANTTGFNNSFFGNRAGRTNVTGTQNSFFGSLAGRDTTGSENSFFGAGAGLENTTGIQNSFFGSSAGSNNLDGSTNAFFGFLAGFNNTSGDANVFVGRNAGISNMTGFSNTMIGNVANVGSPGLSFATAIGAGSTVMTSATIQLGRASGLDTVLAMGDVGIGTLAPGTKLHVVGGTDAEPTGGGYIVSGPTTSNNVAIDDNEIMARSNGSTATLALNADGGNVNLIQAGTGNVGIGTSAPGDKLDVDGDIRVGTSGTNGCLKNNNGGTITGTCSSDARFKRGITPFPTILNSFSQLRPVHYFWRADEFPDKDFGTAQTYGLLAQDVEKTLPELVSTDAHGYKQVDYGKLPLLTIQAVKELKAQNESQQAQIERQQRQINEQRSMIDSLKKLVCGKRRSAGACRR